MKFGMNENISNGSEKEFILAFNLEPANLRKELEKKAFDHAYEISGGEYSDDGYLVVCKHGAPHPHFVLPDAGFTKAEANELLYVGTIKELFTKYSDDSVDASFRQYSSKEQLEDELLKEAMEAVKNRKNI